MTRRTDTSRITGLLVGLVVSLSSVVAVAGEPKEFVQTRTNEVITILKKEDDTSRVEDLQELLDVTVDFREMSKQALGEHWPEEAARQEQFLGLLTRMLKANYSKKLAGKSLKEPPVVRYTDEGERGERAYVTTKVKGKFKDPKSGKRRTRTVEVQYKLLKKEGKWVAYDVVLDDLSTVESYKEEYVEIIEDEGWDGLISEMEDAAKRLEAAK